MTCMILYLGIPPISPMSVEAEKGIIQEYSSLVSGNYDNS